MNKMYFRILQVLNNDFTSCILLFFITNSVIVSSIYIRIEKTIINIMETAVNTNNVKYQRVKDYLLEMSKNTEIKEDFIDRFAYNYAYRG